MVGDTWDVPSLSYPSEANRRNQMKSEWVMCSYKTYHKALEMNLPARSCGGGATEKVYEIKRVDMLKVGGYLVNVSTFDDIPNRGHVKWDYVKLLVDDRHG